jgi:hypothetical protein
VTAFDYAALASRAGDLLTRFGLAASVRRLSGGTYSPVTGATTGTVTTTDTPVRVLAVTLDATYRAEVGSDNVQADDRLYLLPDTFAPVVSDSLLLAGEAWSIVRVQTINPGGTALLYRVQVRR